MPKNVSKWKWRITYIFARCAPRSTYLSIIQIGKKVEDGGPTLLEFNPKFCPIKNENKDKNFS